MLKLFWKNKFTFTFVVLLIGLASFSNVYASKFLQIIIDGTLSGNAPFRFVLLFAGFGFSAGFVLFIENFFERYLKKNFRLELKNNITSHMACETKESHNADKTKYYELFINHFEHFASESTGSFFDAIYNLCLIVFGIVTMYFIFPPFIIFSVLSMFFSGLIFSYVNKKMDVLSNNFVKERSNYYEYVQDILTGHFTIFINRQKKFFTRLTNKNFSHYQDARCNYNVKREWLSTIIYLPYNIFDNAMIIFLFYSILQNWTTIGSLSAVFGLSAFIGSAFENLFYNIVSIRSGLSVLDKKYFTAKKLEPVSISQKAKITSLEVKNLNIAYDENKVFENFNLSLKPGLHYMQAESGSGKSTLLKLITKELPVLENTIFLNGIDINDFSEDEIAEKISYVPQENFILEGTIEENLFDTAQNKKSELEIASAENLASRFENTALTEKSIPIGETRRINIARGLDLKKDLIILDEPFRNLEKEIVEKMKARLSAIEDKIIIAVSHEKGEKM
ncbi:MAG: ABC transporter ATP-binding protein [Treponemataceae bacterium]